MRQFLCSLLALLGSLHLGVLAGDIKFIDFTVNSPHISLAKKYYLTFSLENPLPQASYFRLEFPLALDETVGNSKWMLFSSTTCDFTYPFSLNSLTVVRSTLSSDTAIYVYFLQFGASLSAGTYYTIIVQTSAALLVNSLVLPPIRCSTISINQDNYITYDENMVWGDLNFLD